MAAKRELTVQDWEQEINRAILYRRAYGVEDSWAENEQIFYHVHNSNVTSGPNLLFATGDAMLSQLSVPTPHINIKPRRQEFVTAAPVLETVDNDLLADLAMPRRLDESIMSAFLYGVGIWKIGFDSMWGWDGNLDVGGSVGRVGATLTQYDRKGNCIEYGPARPGMPWVESVLPHDFLVPWGTKDLDSAPWVAHRTVRQLDALKADPKYSNTKTLEASMSMEDWVKSYTTVMKPYRMGDTIGTREGTGDIEYVELWEIHDIRTHQVIVIATGHDKFLRKDHDALAINGVPFVAISFTPRTRNFWVTPDAWYLRAVQAERTDIAVQNTKQRRASVAKTLYSEGAIDDAELVKMTSAEVGTLVKVSGGRNLQEVLYNIQGYNNQQLWQEADRVERDAQSTVGFGNNQMGEFDSSSRRTATEAAVVNQNAGLRMGHRQAAVRDLYTGAFKKINAIIFEFWQLKKQAEYMGRDGVRQWASFTGDNLKGEYAYDVGFSNDAGESLQGRKQMAMTVLQNIGAPFIDPAGAVRYAARAFNDPDLMQVFNPQLLNGVPNAQQQPQGLVPAPPMPGQPTFAPPPGMFGGVANAGMGANQAGGQPPGLRIPHIGDRGGATALAAGV